MFTYEFNPIYYPGKQLFEVVEITDTGDRVVTHFPFQQPSIKYVDVVGSFDKLFQFRSSQKNFQFYRSQVVSPLTADDTLLMQDLIDIIYNCPCTQDSSIVACPAGYDGIYPIVVTNGGYLGCTIGIDTGSVILRGAFVFPFSTTQTQSGNGANWNNNNNTFTPRMLIPTDYTSARYSVYARKSDANAVFECSILEVNADGSLPTTPVAGSIINPAFDDITTDFIYEVSPFFDIDNARQYVFAIRKVSGTGNLEVSTVTMEAVQ